MASDREWFTELWSCGAITRPNVVEWAKDLLALGPHGEWIEPVRLALLFPNRYQRAFLPEAPVQPIEQDLYSLVTATHSMDVWLHAAHVAGLVPLETKVKISAIDNGRLLEPFWARSGEQVRRQIATEGDEILDASFVLIPDQLVDVVAARVDSGRIGVGPEALDSYLAFRNRGGSKSSAVVLARELVQDLDAAYERQWIERDLTAALQEQFVTQVLARPRRG